MAWLLFIDTNIYLGFYRWESSDPIERQLKFIFERQEEIITTYQVQMEFLKNRQGVIQKSFDAISKAYDTIRNHQQLLEKAPPASETMDLVRQIGKQQSAVQKKIKNVLGKPDESDLVYQSVQKLYKRESELNLTWHNEARPKIFGSAQERHLLGYPPRKDKDTSIGDAINWEWIVHIAKRLKKNVLIVSNDYDYGSTYKNKDYMNDWLSHEFKERVGKSKKVELTRKLTEAMRRMGVKVSKEEEEQEEKMLEGPTFAEIFQSSSAMPIFPTSSTHTFPSFFAPPFPSSPSRFEKD